MLYAILAYHEESAITAMTPQQDNVLMDRLMEAHERINEKGTLGPAARLDFTGKAVTLRGSADAMVIDGPFAETKEQLLGLYVLECASLEEAIESARDLRRVNTSAVYEIRPITFYLPGNAVQG
ncbi:YciI family protein [Mesorhizobium sp. CAU 1732]|uniref:YciI family protein n=1 Tax=Mesorhizobium sp. CAU 1732 TaxID=3140358 RepID=UPI003261A9A8